MRRKTSSTAGATGPGNQPADSHSTAELGERVATANCKDVAKMPNPSLSTDRATNMKTETQLPVPSLNSVKGTSVPKSLFPNALSIIRPLWKKAGIKEPKAPVKAPTCLEILGEDYKPYGRARRARVRKIMEQLADVSPKSLEEWEAGFQLSLFPEFEIGSWEDMAGTYTQLTDSHELTPAQKKDLYCVLFQCSMIPEQFIWDTPAVHGRRTGIVKEAITMFYDRRRKLSERPASASKRS